MARSVARFKPAFYISVIGVLFVLNVRRTTILVWFLVASLGVKKKKNDDDSDDSNKNYTIYSGAFSTE